MEGLSLGTLVDEHLAIAREHESGRSAVTIHGGREHHLRQTLIALLEGRALASTTARARPPCRCCAAGSGCRRGTMAGKAQRATTC